MMDTPFNEIEENIEKQLDTMLQMLAGLDDDGARTMAKTQIVNSHTERLVNEMRRTGFEIIAEHEEKFTGDLLLSLSKEAETARNDLLRYAVETNQYTLAVMIIACKENARQLRIQVALDKYSNVKLP